MPTGEPEKGVAWGGQGRQVTEDLGSHREGWGDRVGL